MNDSCFEFLSRGETGFLKARARDGLGFVEHAFLTRTGGASEGDFHGLNLSYQVGDREEKVRSNWMTVSEVFDIPPDSFITVRQVHQDGVLVIDKKPLTRDILIHLKTGAFDAIVTNQPGLALVVKTADCVPILLADPVKKIIGVVHAGWKGTALAVAGKTIKAFEENFSGHPADMIALLGPAIGPCCYQVDQAVYEAFGQLSKREEYFEPCKQKDKWRLDLLMANRVQLSEGGVPKENIIASEVCTSCRRALFFSHRAAGGKTGRQVNFIMIK